MLGSLGICSKPRFEVDKHYEEGHLLQQLLPVHFVRFYDIEVVRSIFAFVWVNLLILRLYSVNFAGKL